MMRRCTILVLALALSAFLIASISYAGTSDKKETKADKKETKVDKKESKAGKGEKVALVNGKEITKSELDSETSRFEQQMTMTGQKADAAQSAEIRKKVLDGLVERELLLQESQRLGIKIADAEVDEQVNALKKKFPNESDFSEALKKMGITEGELRKQIGQSAVIKKMIDQEVASKVTVSDEESKAFYTGHPDLFKVPERVRASHILVKVDSNASDSDKAKAREKMVQIQKRLKGGEDFAKVAKEVSECPSAPNGGDLDYFQRGQMVGPFEDAAFALKPGETSDIVETQFGYHIIKVTDKKQPGTMSYDEMKDRIGQHLKQEKVNQQVAQYIDQLKSKAKIETFNK